MRTILFALLFFPIAVFSAIRAGTGKVDITPAIGTPSAGYAERKGAGMEGTHDPLLAIALFIDNANKQVVFCSVDHLGFTYEMVQAITQNIHSQRGLEKCEVFIGSSHTHSGGGSYLNIPVLGAALAGKYDADITQQYIDRTCEAICQAYQNQTDAKLGIGYGEAESLSKYRGLWPEGVPPLRSVTVIKVTDTDDNPLATLFNYPIHPTVLTHKNRLFSADLVGYARDYLRSSIGGEAIYFNGAQGDIIPNTVEDEEAFSACDRIGKSLAETVEAIANAIVTSDALEIATQKISYSFEPQATPFGLTLPVPIYHSEMNLIVLNRTHAFFTVPGELSCLYDTELKALGSEMGLYVSIFGLTNDAHGYIITPDSWRHKTYESALSFGGEWYGDTVPDTFQTLVLQTPYFY